MSIEPAVFALALEGEFESRAELTERLAALHEVAAQLGFRIIEDAEIRTGVLLAAVEWERDAPPPQLRLVR